MRAGWVVVAMALLSGSAAARPTLSGTEQTRLSVDGHVRFHFTLEGADAISGTVAIDAAEAGMATMWAAFVDDDGWPAPAADGGVGGDDRLDVYLRALDRNGLAQIDAGSCFIELDIDAASRGNGVFASIAGHELHHCLQFAVAPGLAPWIYEATATYAQYALFDGDPQVALARDFHWQTRLGGSALAIDTVGDQFEYAGMVWIKYLVDRGGGDRTRLLALWQAMAAAGTWQDGHNMLLAPDTIDDAAAEYATWAWFACGNDDGHHFDPQTVRCSVPAQVMTVDASSGTSDPIGRHGSRYVRIAPDPGGGDVDITLQPHAAMRFTVIEWRLDGESTVQSWRGSDGQRWTATVTGWNELRGAIVVGTALEDGASFAWQARPVGEPKEDAIGDAICSCGSGDAGIGAAGLAVLTLLVLRRRRGPTVGHTPRAAWTDRIFDDDGG